MLRIISFCLLITLQVVTSVPPPSQCKTYGLPPGLESVLLIDLLKCCDVPMIFKDKDFNDCGIDKNLLSLEVDTLCPQGLCLFKKNNLIKNETKIDTERMVAHLDRWAEINSDFKEAIKKSKKECLKTDLTEQNHPCIATVVHFCVFAHNFYECPKWQDSDKCRQVKKYIECEPFLS